jgi:hypothetical protein
VATVQAEGIEGMKALQGKTIGPSEWREVTQEEIDDFARLSGDDQWIHVDVERARKESPFGTTIAHGNLTLSMIDGLRRDLISSTGFTLGVNGSGRVRRSPTSRRSGAAGGRSSPASRSRWRARRSQPASLIRLAERCPSNYLTVSVPSIPPSRCPGTSQ